MPELPEVETIRRQLSPHLTGRRILRTEAHLARRTFPDVDTFVAQTEGRHLLAVMRHGKQLYVALETGYLLVHLGMTGRLSLERDGHVAPPSSWTRHRHAVLHLDDGSRLVFTDPRTFGALGVSETLDFLTGMGPDPLTVEFAPDRLVNRLRSSRTAVKSALLNQGWVAGLGNIYADEVCWLAGVHPARPGDRTSLPRLRALVGHIEPVLTRAIEAAGATLKDGGYQDLFGQEGRYHPHAYGRTGEPCERCGTALRRGVLGQSRSARSYHYCPRCQKA
ncbi:MAG TPA: bifunctional DNA-formamidopyrimidine glycosylase/DNA-(apurinic or apyrimidinic site) lyase [Candidatus Xenobia bacterium]|jgi:formamidopyrimidine-DNA glycosylase